MRISLDIPEGAFLKAKSLEEIAREAREAAILFWIVRGDMDSTRVAPSAPAQGSPASFWDALATMPDVGADEDFARPHDLGRLPPLDEEERE